MKIKPKPKIILFIKGTSKTIATDLKILNITQILNNPNNTIAIQLTMGIAIIKRRRIIEIGIRAIKGAPDQIVIVNVSLKYILAFTSNENNLIINATKNINR